MLVVTITDYCSLEPLRSCSEIQLVSTENRSQMHFVLDLPARRTYHFATTAVRSRHRCCWTHFRLLRCWAAVAADCRISCNRFVVTVMGILGCLQHRSLDCRKSGIGLVVAAAAVGRNRCRMGCRNFRHHLGCLGCSPSIVGCWTGSVGNSCFNPSDWPNYHSTHPSYLSPSTSVGYRTFGCYLVAAFVSKIRDLARIWASQVATDFTNFAP